MINCTETVAPTVMYQLLKLFTVSNSFAKIKRSMADLAALRLASSKARNSSLSYKSSSTVVHNGRANCVDATHIHLVESINTLEIIRLHNALQNSSETAVVTRVIDSQSALILTFCTLRKEFQAETSTAQCVKISVQAKDF